MPLKELMIEKIKELADMNKDGQLDYKDALLLIQLLVAYTLSNKKDNK